MSPFLGTLSSLSVILPKSSTNVGVLTVVVGISKSMSIGSSIMSKSLWVESVRRLRGPDKTGLFWTCDLLTLSAMLLSISSWYSCWTSLRISWLSWESFEDKVLSCKIMSSSFIFESSVIKDSRTECSTSWSSVSLFLLECSETIVTSSIVLLVWNIVSPILLRMVTEGLSQFSSWQIPFEIRENSGSSLFGSVLFSVLSSSFSAKYLKCFHILNEHLFTIKKMSKIIKPLKQWRILLELNDNRITIFYPRKPWDEQGRRPIKVSFSFANSHVTYTLNVCVLPGEILEIITKWQV